MTKLATAFLFLGFLSAQASFASEVYKCSAKDSDSGAIMLAELSLNGTVADFQLTTDALPGCRNVRPLNVTGAKPILNVAGEISCDGEEPEDLVLVLNTAKKTLSFGDLVFSCR